jgi:hypothetical protein
VDDQVALRQSEARKTAILEMALDGIITMDHEGKVIEFNPQPPGLLPVYISTTALSCSSFSAKGVHTARLS